MRAPVQIAHGPPQIVSRSVRAVSLTVSFLMLPSSKPLPIHGRILTLLNTPLDYGPANTNTLYRCDNDQWCCSRGGNKTSCCNDPNVATFLPQRNAAQIYNGSAFAAGFALSQTSAFTSSASASAARATGTKATATRASGDSSPTTSGSCNNNTCPVSINDNAETTKVGVGVSVGLGIPLLVALAVTLFLWSREKKRSRDFQQQAAMAGQQLPWGNASVGYGSANGRTDGQQTFYEVPGQTGGYGVAEMVGGDGRREMAGNPTVK